MPLVVPALRLLMVFMNVYDTYKSLKIPPGRKGGPPSIKAMTQRKRDLKGCLAVWVVWCCLAAYERTFDRFISFIVPFYSEIKSVMLLFLLLTRAKGAEPLYLHILRPLIKPYVDTLDPLLDLARDIGDFLFALSQVPLNYVLSLCSGLPWHTEENESAADLSENTPELSTTRSSSDSSIPIAAKAYTTVDSNSRVAEKRSVAVRSIPDNRVRPKSRHPPVDSYESMSLRMRHSKSSSMTTLPHYNTVGRIHARPTINNTRTAAHQIWYPPPPAYEEEHRRSRSSIGRSEMANVSTPNLATPPPAVVVSEPADEDWRGYPPFPSAYPPTPLAASHSLPGAMLSGQNISINSPSAQITVISPIPEDTLVDRSQDFDVSLQQAHAPVSPGSSGCSSDANSSLQVHPSIDEFQSFGGVGSQDENEDAYMDDEDDFDVTLRTPYRSFPSSVASNASSSVGSLPSALTTNDNASSLRTSSSSESAHSFHTSDSSHYAGQKRPYPAVTMTSRTAAVSAIPRNTTMRGKATTTAPSYENDLDSETDDDSEDSDEDSGAKRRKVLKPTQRTTYLRPTAKPIANVRKPPLTTRTFPASTRGKSSAPAPKTGIRGGSRVAPQTVGVASRGDTLRGQTRRSTSKLLSQDTEPYPRTVTARNKA